MGEKRQLPSADDDDGNKDGQLTPSERRVKPSSINILEDSSMESFVKYIKENGCKRILVMTGAGISTSAGIPDFRSPNTGLYDNLAQYDLPYPEAVFHIRYFRMRPEPFYTLARELYPGVFKPTKCHYFIKLLAKKKMLQRNYTQNIDTLERVAKIPNSLIVEAHGSFATAHCIGGRLPLVEDFEGDETTYASSCGKEYSQEWVKTKILAGEIPTCSKCNGLVKPDVTFFGEALPKRFFTLHPSDLSEADALIVIGTSLKVQPFASLLSRVSPKTPRLFINRNLLGVNAARGFDFTGANSEFRRDAFFPGDCDDGCQKLAELLGFGDELEKLLIYEHGRILVESERTSMPPMQSPTQPEITQTSSQKIGGTERTIKLRERSTT